MDLKFSNLFDENDLKKQLLTKNKKMEYFYYIYSKKEKKFLIADSLDILHKIKTSFAVEIANQYGEKPIENYLYFNDIRFERTNNLEEVVGNYMFRPDGEER